MIIIINSKLAKLATYILDQFHHNIKVKSALTSTLKWQPSAYCASGSPISAASTNKAAPLFAWGKGKSDYEFMVDRTVNIFLFDINKTIKDKTTQNSHHWSVDRYTTLSTEII